MPGIIVGIDGSTHSRQALEWAVNEAAIRHAPLTVLTVHQAVAGIFTRAVTSPGDENLTRQAREAAQQETDDVLSKVDEGSRPPSVTVGAVNGLPAEELIKASAGADMIVLGSRGAGGFARLRMGSVGSQVTHHAVCPVVVIPAETI
jgi:nucleotide-binding universal stress UspA family protein